MSLVISSGIQIAPGIKIVGASAIRASLSAAGQSAYDAAYQGDFFTVSASDYNSVKSSLANTRTIGDSAAAILYNGALYSGTCAALQTSQNTAVDAGVFIVGFVARHQSTSNANFRYLVSTAAITTYTQLANQVPVTNVSASPSYYIRKDPEANVSTLYVGIVSNTGLMVMSNTVWSGGSYNCAVSNAASISAPWNARFNATQPIFQTLLCDTKQW